MQTIKIDFDNPGLPQRLDVVENDAQSRFFKAVLYKDGKAYATPSGATYSIMYRGFGPQNEGWYDTIKDGAGKRAACSVSGNVVTCEIARKALRVPGHVSVVLCVTGSHGYMLHGWPIDCNCRNDNYTGGTSVESFFYITQVTNADWTSAIKNWEELKNMIDPTLSISGNAADAAKVGEAVGQIKEDLDTLGIEALSTEMYKKINVHMEIGALDGAGTLISNTRRIRTSDWVQFDYPTIIFKKFENINSAVMTLLLKKDTTGKITQVHVGDGVGRTGTVWFLDTTSTYKFVLSFADNHDIVDANEIIALKQYFNIVELKGIGSIDYSEKIFYLECGTGTIKDGDTIELISLMDNQLLSPFVYSVNLDGTLVTKNPNGYSIIVYEIDEKLRKLSRKVYSSELVEINLKAKSIYAISLYKPGLTLANYDPIVCRFINNKSLVAELGGIVDKLKTKIGNSEEIPLSFESGAFNAGGANVQSNTRIRTDKIKASEEYIYVFTLPSSLECTANSTIYGNRSNFKNYVNGFTIYGVSDYIRIAIKRVDETPFVAADLTQSEKNSIHLYRVRRSRYCAVTVSASAEYPADFFVTKETGQPLLQALCSSMKSIKISLAPGEYYLTDVYTSNASGQKAFLMTNDALKSDVQIQLTGYYQNTRSSDDNSTRIIINAENCDDATEYATILVPRHTAPENSPGTSYTILSLNGIKLIGDAYTKKMVYIDATHAQAFCAENVEVRADGSYTGLKQFPTKPNDGCVGIRAGQGSNNGIQNYIKHCMAYFCAKGFSICGEHFVLEDNLAHHCLIGFAFGDRLTRGNYEHPNIMIGCSVEGCYRLMLLTKYGYTDESSPVIGPRNTLICIGLSTECSWAGTEDGKMESGTTLPIKEIIKGQYKGRIEGDYFGKNVSIFEEGSGTNMSSITY